MMNDAKTIDEMISKEFDRCAWYQISNETLIMKIFSGWVMKTWYESGNSSPAMTTIHIKDCKHENEKDFYHQHRSYHEYINSLKGGRNEKWKFQI